MIVFTGEPGCLIVYLMKSCETLLEKPHVTFSVYISFYMFLFFLRISMFVCDWMHTYVIGCQVNGFVIVPCDNCDITITRKINCTTTFLFKAVDFGRGQPASRFSRRVWVAAKPRSFKGYDVKKLSKVIEMFLGSSITIPDINWFTTWVPRVMRPQSQIYPCRQRDGKGSFTGW